MFNPAFDIWMLLFALGTSFFFTALIYLMAGIEEYLDDKDSLDGR